jgi:hypothetical protein
MSNKSTLIPSSLIVLFSLTLTTSIPLPMIIDKKQIAYGNSATNQDHSNSNNIQFSSIGLEMPANKLSADLGIINSNFTTLFDGKTLDGWKMAGDGRFVVIEEDGSVESEGGMGLLWHTKQKYHNFILKLEWRISDEGDNSGVFVRFPDPDDNPRIAVREGYEIQIDDKAGDAIHQTGAIYDFAVPTKVASNPAGQWNTMEIQVINQFYTIIINGEKVTEFTGNRQTEGYIGLQAHDDESKVSFRNIMIKEVS